MGIGDVHEVTVGDCSDLYCLDTGMYDTAEYGAVYLVDDDRPAIVDTGIGTNHEYVLDALETVGIGRDELSVIAVTHVHLDHAGGAGFVADACPNAEVYAPDVGGHHLVDPTRLVEGTKAAVGDQWEYYAEPKPVSDDRMTTYEDGDTVDLGTHELRVHAAPGHAPHHHVFEDPANDAIFTADAAGIWVPAIEEIRETSPPPQFDLEGCLADVRMLEELGRSTLLYGHFGARRTDDALATYRSVLTEWVEAVAARREELGDDDAVVEHFAEATDLNDVWGERKAKGEATMNTRGVLAYLDRRE